MTRSQGVALECSPAVPRRFWPPARATSSGPQFPMLNTGSIHSRHTMVTGSSLRVPSAMAAMRERSPDRSVSPASAASSTRDTARLGAGTEEARGCSAGDRLRLLQLLGRRGCRLLRPNDVLDQPRQAADGRARVPARPGGGEVTDLLSLLKAA